MYSGTMTRGRVLPAHLAKNGALGERTRTQESGCELCI
jgi:hypothetical protein